MFCEKLHLYISQLNAAAHIPYEGHVALNTHTHKTRCMCAPQFRVEWTKELSRCDDCGCECAGGFNYMLRCLVWLVKLRDIVCDRSEASTEKSVICFVGLFGRTYCIHPKGIRESRFNGALKYISLALDINASQGIKCRFD